MLKDIYEAESQVVFAEFEEASATKTFQDFEVTSYPTIYVWNSETEIATQFDGARTFQNLYDFIQSHLPTWLKVVS